MTNAARIAFVLAAWPGHAFTLTVTLNLIYSFPLPRKLQRGGRLVVAILVFAFPALAIFDFGGDELRWTLLTAYLWFAIAVGWFALPILTVRRLLRKPPSLLVGSSSHVVDLAK